ncbi:MULTISPECIES: glycerol dehydrogenase [unclassified Enterococcus]|uniref:glycerol dehydrogenase n=1 Tax=unclassified Enterococcus TaxID=2608891 RepID=UPI0024763E37|nr:MULTISPECIES: glycerol dehydrogenase [unclassified Enterococcus]
MRTFCSPANYIQGANILDSHLEVFKALGKNGLIITDSFVWEMTGAKLATQLAAMGLAISKYLFKGESSEEEVAAIKASVAADLDFVIGLGGGKAIDVAKSVANQLNLQIAIVPTTAATDAPTSRISVIYQEDGSFSHYQLLKKNPDLVFVDTAVIVQAPTRFLASGIADGLATFVEVQAIQKGHGKNLVGGSSTLAALAIAEQCEKTLFAEGELALKANEMKVVTPAFENVVEANTLLSGLGFESGGLAAAHALHNAFSVLRSEVHQLTHGEKVAFTTLVQLVLENAPLSRLNQFVKFYQALGLPTTLAEMKLADLSEADLKLVAAHAVNENDTLQQMGLNLTAADIYAAILTLDNYVKSL